MNKDELIEILQSLDITVNEGIQNDKDRTYPRIVFWEFGWEPLTASGDVYNTKVIYQISFFSDVPRHSKLIKLLSLLHDKGIMPYVEHEYIQEDRYFHSYFSLEVLENVE